MIGELPPAPTGTVPFGYRDVAPDEKPRLVRGIFDSVAARYDLMNDLMSGGLHRLWKRELVDWLAPRPGQRLLDLAGGTGDVALRAAKRPHGPIVVCDLTPAMLTIGRNKAIDRGLIDGIVWIAGNAESLPFANASFDACTIAFGLRNVARIDLALAEIRRVLRPGGHFLCLEFSKVVVPGLRALYDRYSFDVLPALGGMVAGDEDSYRYLAESIRRFPDQERLAGIIAGSGLGQVTHRNLSGGVAAIHSAWRL